MTGCWRRWGDGRRNRSGGFLLEALDGQLEFLDAGEEALGELAGIGVDVDAVLAVEARGAVALERVLELFAACAAGAEAGGRLGFGHGRELLIAKV